MSLLKQNEYRGKPESQLCGSFGTCKVSILTARLSALNSSVHRCYEDSDSLASALIAP